MQHRQNDSVYDTSRQIKSLRKTRWLLELAHKQLLLNTYKKYKFGTGTT